MSVDVTQFQPVTAYIMNLTTSSVNQVLSQPVNAIASGTAIGQTGNYVLDVYNANASKVAFFQTGMSSQTGATTSIYQVPPAMTKRFRMSGPHTNLGAILDTGASASNLYVMLGDGGV